MTVYADKFYAATKYLQEVNKELTVQEIAERLDYNTDSGLFSFWEPIGKDNKYFVLTLQERAERILSHAEDELDTCTAVDEISNQDIINWLACYLADGSDTESIIGGKEVEHEDGFYIYKVD